MSGAGPTRLYTPQVLALATGLAAFPLDDSLPLRGEARSRTCGSDIVVGIDLEPSGMIARIGMQVRAGVGRTAGAGRARAQRAGSGARP